MLFGTTGTAGGHVTVKRRNGPPTESVRIKHEAWKAAIREWRVNGRFHECVTTPRVSFKQLVSGSNPGQVFDSDQLEVEGECHGSASEDGCGVVSA